MLLKIDASKANAPSAIAAQQHKRPSYNPFVPNKSRKKVVRMTPKEKKKLKVLLKREDDSDEGTFTLFFSSHTYLFAILTYIMKT